MNSSTLFKLDWNLIQAFLAVVENGAVARAAEATGVSQSTLSRQIAALETELGAALFTRGARGSLLTPTGAALVDSAQQMNLAAHQLHLAAAGQSQKLTGTVRISASEIICAYLLPEMLAECRFEHPEIQIELVANNDIDDLLERKADIAIRHIRPSQNSLVARNLGAMAMGGYASEPYLQRKSLTFSPATMTSFDMIGFDTNEVMLRGMKAIGIHLTRESFAVRSDSAVVCWQAVLEGMGIGMGLDVLAVRHPILRRVLPVEWVPAIPVWLTSPQELRSNPRIRLVFDLLAQKFGEITQP
jgi:DNA-binding transcriptional LysR family regulator